MSLDLYINALGPEVVLIIGACVALLLGAARSELGGVLVAPLCLLVVILSLITTAVAGIPRVQPAGVRITELTFYIRTITLVVGSLILLVNWHLPNYRERGEFFGMVLFSMLGVMLTAVANDLVLLFFALELVSVPTYILVALSREDARASEGSIKYFFLGAMSAAIMAYGFSFLYGCAGTTRLYGDGGIADFFATGGISQTYALIGLLLVFGGLAFKVAAVPFHVYVADVYEGAASPVTGLLGFLPKIGGFVALIRIADVCNWHFPDAVAWGLWIVAAATMTAGNVLALLQTNVKRILAYSSIAHSGYMLIGLLVGPVAGHGPLRDGVAALLFYIAVYGVMNLGAFAVLSAFSLRGKAVEHLEDLHGLSKRDSLTALLMAVCVFSLMGFPPTAGFLGKVYIFTSAFSLTADHAFRVPLIWLAVIGVINSAIGAAYYLRIAAACYLGDRTQQHAYVGGAPLRLATAVCGLLMLILFVWPSVLIGSARSATKTMSHTPPLDQVAMKTQAAPPLTAQEGGG